MALTLAIANTVLSSIILFISGLVFFRSLDKKSHMTICGFVMATQALSILTTWTLYGLI